MKQAGFGFETYEPDAVPTLIALEQRIRDTGNAFTNFNTHVLKMPTKYTNAFGGSRSKGSQVDHARLVQFPLNFLRSFLQPCLLPCLKYLFITIIDKSGGQLARERLRLSNRGTCVVSRKNQRIPQCVCYTVHPETGSGEQTDDHSGKPHGQSRQGPQGVYLFQYTGVRGINRMDRCAHTPTDGRIDGRGTVSVHVHVVIR